MEIFLTCAISVVAGIVQGVTGFGAGIVIMLVLPLYFAIPQSAGMVAAICIMLTLSMTWSYRKSINAQNIFLPALGYMLVCSIAIQFSVGASPALLKNFLGIFLLCLSIYYLFLKKNSAPTKLSKRVKIICVVVSGICDGLFGIGGPLMVVYYLSISKSAKEYLGTLSAFFCVNCLYSTAFRVFAGVLQAEHLPIILSGCACIFLGGLIAKKLVDRLDENFISKATYIMIGIAGITNLV